MRFYWKGTEELKFEYFSWCLNTSLDTNSLHYYVDRFLFSLISIYFYIHICFILKKCAYVSEMYACQVNKQTEEVLKG